VSKTCLIDIFCLGENLKYDLKNDQFDLKVEVMVQKQFEQLQIRLEKCVLDLKLFSGYFLSNFRSKMI
jgi:hypothetical protein